MLKVELNLRPCVAALTSRSMVCAKCGKDVPAVPVVDDPQAVQCLHCGTLAILEAESTSANACRGAVCSPADVIRRVEHAFPIEPPPVILDDDDVDGPQAIDESREAREATDRVLQPAHRQVRPRSIARPSSSRFCWLLLSLGIAAFSCGACLIGYSLLGEREELWDLGAPLVLTGQAMFLVGLVLQLDVIWQQNKATSQTLRELDQRLSQENESAVERAPQPATLTGAGVTLHSGGTAVAAPHLALRDLQGRLEAFGSRMGRRGS